MGVRALSLWQPWGNALASGLKPEETRPWSTTYRGPVAIHAAKRWTRDQAKFAMERIPDLPGAPDLGCAAGVSLLAYVQSPEAWPRGCVLAVAELVDVVPIEQRTPNAWGDFAPGRFAWLFQHMVRCKEPVPLVGRQGLWTLKPEEKARVLAQITPGIWT